MSNKILALIVLAALSAGCGVKAQSYIMTRERVDQEPKGNGGCLSGQCAPMAVSDKKTRKVYVLELTKSLPESEVKKIEQEAAANVSSAPVTEAPTTPAVEEYNSVVIPPIEDESVAQTVVSSTGPTTDQSYTVLKDDTLQKISKKFYGTFSKWLKIYEANKNKIKNPNFVKPGTVITIPAVK